VCALRFGQQCWLFSQPADAEQLAEQGDGGQNEVAKVAAAKCAGDLYPGSRDTYFMVTQAAAGHTCIGKQETRPGGISMESEIRLSESVVRDIVRLVGHVADMRGSRAIKRRALMNGLSSMIEADAWSWIISRAANNNDNPAVAAYQHGGYSEEQHAAYASLMQDRKNTPIEYAALNQLRRSKQRFTRRWDQLVTAEEWYGPRNRTLLDTIGFEHVMYCVRVMDADGFFSGISLKRKTGRDNFTPLQQRIAHIVTGEIDWLHFDENLSHVTKQVRPLSPRRRTVLTLLLEGCTKEEISQRLGCTTNTVKEHVKAIYVHFNVQSTAKLFRHFMAGDGYDID
jgi:DNA-binding CsgD family transcriptional regulator